MPSQTNSLSPSTLAGSTPTRSPSIIHPHSISPLNPAYLERIAAESTSPRQQKTSTTWIAPSHDGNAGPAYGHNPNPEITPFDKEGAYFVHWRNDRIRAMLEFLHERKLGAGVEGRGGWTEMEVGEKRIVDCMDMEGLAAVLDFYYNFAGNFDVMFGGHDGAGAIKVHFYRERTAHPDLPEIKIIGYTWIRNTFTTYANNATSTQSYELPSTSSPVPFPRLGVLVRHNGLKKRKWEQGEEALVYPPGSYDAAKAGYEEIEIVAGEKAGHVTMPGTSIDVLASHT
ncbi:MAG: hypothetical protein Q9169_002209 [Polycauliona sp. 2 TL-2023]